MTPPAPGGVLLIGYGNPGRLDDGLGPAFAEAVAEMRIPGVSTDADYQLSVEDAELLSAFESVVFADASVTGPEPYSFQPVDPEGSLPFSTHVLDPARVLGLAREMFGATTRGYVLGIRGYRFDEFGEELSGGALNNLAAALRFLEPLLRARTFEAAVPAAPVPSNDKGRIPPCRPTSP